MELIISGRHLPVDEHVRAFAEHRMHRLEKEYPKLTSGRLVLELERSWCVAEIHLNGKKLTLDASAKSHDVLVSIDAALEKLERQLLRHVKRLQDHRVSRAEEALEEGDEEDETSVSDEGVPTELEES